MKKANHKTLLIFIISCLILIAAFLAFKIQTTGQSLNSPQVINKEFNFPLKDNKGQELAKLKYTIESAELMNKILVQGKTVSLVKGRTFLIINLKLTNNFNKPIKVNTKDYARLVINGNEKELLAPDIHSDPVAIKPNSSEATRVGFAISDSDKNLKLKVGEITGEKTSIDIKL